MTDRGGEQIHLAAVKRLLLRTIAVVLIGSCSLVAVEPKGIGTARTILGIDEIRILGQQFRSIALNLGGSSQRRKCWLSRRVQCVRICPKVVVEGNILLEQNDDMPDPILCRIFMRCV